ncbi:MAG: LytR C-terminal domain-containing protein [Acidimicrobiales bacterium]
MRPGRHAAGDGSFGRSAGAAAGRGVLLLAVALAVGIGLIQVADDLPPGEQVTVVDPGGDGPETTRPGETATTLDDSTPLPTTPLRAPADVKVLVANASGVARMAATVSDLIKPGAYNVLAPVTARAQSATSNVFYTEGFEGEAQVLAVSLSLVPTTAQAMPAPAPVANLSGTNLLVVVGKDLASRVAATTTTTARATTTTAR